VEGGIISLAGLHTVLGTPSDPNDPGPGLRQGDGAGRSTVNPTHSLIFFTMRAMLSDDLRRLLFVISSASRRRSAMT
jgi:hypothetical protein